MNYSLCSAGTKESPLSPFPALLVVVATSCAAAQAGIAAAGAR